MSEKTEVSQDKKRRSINWLILFIPLMGACFALAIITQIFADEVWLAPGNPDAFDPIVYYEDVLDYAGDDVQFTGMFIQFVQQDGTLDLNAGYEPSPFVRYAFYRPTRENNAPTGASTNDEIWHRIVQVTISQPFEWAVVTAITNDGLSINVNLGMDRDTSIEQLAPVAEIASVPICDLSVFWDIALANANIPDDAVATIIYDATGYQFTIQGTAINLRFDPQCTQVT